MKGKLIIDIDLADDLKNGVIADPNGVADRLLDFLCHDPDDLFPESEVVSEVRWERQR